MYQGLAPRRSTGGRYCAHHVKHTCSPRMCAVGRCVRTRSRLRSTESRPPAADCARRRCRRYTVAHTQQVSPRTGVALAIVPAGLRAACNLISSTIRPAGLTPGRRRVEEPATRDPWQAIGCGDVIPAEVGRDVTAAGHLGHFRQHSIGIEDRQWHIGRWSGRSRRRRRTRCRRLAGRGGRWYGPATLVELEHILACRGRATRCDRHCGRRGPNPRNLGWRGQLVVHVHRLSGSHSGDTDAA